MQDAEIYIYFFLMQHGGWGKKEDILWEEEEGLSPSRWEEEGAWWEYGSFAQKCLISAGTETQGQQKRRESRPEPDFGQRSREISKPRRTNLNHVK